MYKIKVYNWNPNGTNDISIMKQGESVDGMGEALFGLNIGRSYGKYIPLKTVLKYIAISPVSDGSDTINFLKKYFKSIK